MLGYVERFINFAGCAFIVFERSYYEVEHWQRIVVGILCGRALAADY